MNKINLVLIPLAAAGGVFIGFYLGKRKYEGLADIEVESLKRYYEDRTEEPSEVPAGVRIKEIKKVPDPTSDNRLVVANDISEYKDYSKRYQSGKSGSRIPGDIMSGSDKELTEEERQNSDGPYVITSEEFAETDYESRTLFFYTDRVLADEDYNIVHDIAGTIGEEALASFGNGDCVYVRNDQLCIDYEILIDERYFGKIANTNVPGLNSGPE